MLFDYLFLDGVDELAGSNVALHVEADGQVNDDRNVVMLEMVRRTDAGQHQELRRGDRARADDDLVVGVSNLVLAVVLVLDAVRTGPRIVSAKNPGIGNSSGIEDC